MTTRPNKIITFSSSRTIVLLTNFFLPLSLSLSLSLRGLSENVNKNKTSRSFPTASTTATLTPHGPWPGLRGRSRQEQAFRKPVAWFLGILMSWSRLWAHLDINQLTRGLGILTKSKEIKTTTHEPWLWRSWQSGRFQHHSPVDRIPISAMKYFEYLSIKLRKDKNIEKEARNGPFKKEEDYKSFMGRILM